MTTGVNVVGDFGAAHGVAEAARRVVDALVVAGVDVSIVDTRSEAARDDRRRSALIESLPVGVRHPIDLVLLNINEVGELPKERSRYTIALWFWELLELDRRQRRQCRRVDEVWAASDFVAFTFRALGAGPVTVIPAVVSTQRSEDLAQGPVELPVGLRVLFTFDANSSVARKNPFACIDAFRRAFTDSERGASAHLVVKMLSGDGYPGLTEQVAAAVRGVNGTLVTDDLSRSQMEALLGACDIYLSLHRSEGFGLGMAEAMSLGKVVVGTAFGGNTAFMTSDNSCLVGFRMREITPADHDLQPGYLAVYPPGRRWAEPDVAQAAGWLRLLADDGALRAQIGARAAAHVCELASPVAVGTAMSARLAQIAESLQLAN